ncbi:hypothetical protein G4B88_023336 [Cannabis sativa]|uniref:Uncharacterized protein n=1 Tax=Cannabis sativa TaxID=3483 RepID=A0A7J6HZ75_CANSA|nr:hypothetical protein G4B88_023336 [Cannabis sativa]
MANPSSQDDPEENEAHTAPQNPPTQKRRTQQEGTAPHMATKKQKKRNQREVQRVAPTLEAKARYDQSTWDPNVSVERPDNSLESSENQPYVSSICSTNHSDKHQTSYFFTTPMDTTHRAFNHTGTYSRPIPTEEMIQHAAALTAMPDAEKSAPKIVTPETLKLVGLYPLEHNTTVASTIDGPDAPAIPIDGGNPSHGNFTTADSSIHMSLPPTTSRRDTGVIVSVDSNPEDTTMLNDYSSEDSDMFHQLIASYGESEDVNESGGEESAPDLPLVPRACSQLRKPCHAAVEGEENAQASPSVPNIGGRMRRPSIVVPIIRPNDATIQMLESVDDHIDLLVRKTATVEVVRDMSNYEGDTVTKGVQDILRGVTQFMVSNLQSSNLQEKLAAAEAALKEQKKLSALSDAKHERDKDDLKEILGRRLTELNNAQTRLEERKTQVNYYIDQNFDLAKKNTALEKALDTVTKEHDSAVKAFKDTIQKHEERAAKDRQTYKRAFNDQFYQLWKNNQKLNLSHMPPQTKDKELMKCKARLLREATLPSTTNIPGDSTSMDPPEDTLP